MAQEAGYKHLNTMNDLRENIEGFRCWERGSVLIVTMWIVLVLAGLILVFSRSMRVEAIASANHISSLKADSIAQSAMQFIRARLNEEDEKLMLEGESPYEKIPVGDGYFWLLRPNLEDDSTHYFGIRDEAAKINLNSATLEMLLKLPSMTSELAAAIIDWRDTDSDVTTGGAENEYYLLLEEPHYCKNSDLETVGEVFLLKGASAELLYGEDANRNGVLDRNENDADESEPSDNQDGRLDRGFYDYVTVYSMERNVSKDGEQRINVNNTTDKNLSKLIRDVVQGDRYFEVMDRLRMFSRFQNILEFYINIGLKREEFEQIEDRITTSSKKSITGLININSAPREVLLCLPELVETDVDAIIEKRASEDTDTSSIAWVTDVLSPEKAKAIGGHITANSSRYSADIVSVGGDGRAYRRYRAVMDTQDDGFKIIYWRSLTHLGWPLDTEIIETLRRGEILDEA